MRKLYLLLMMLMLVGVVSAVNECGNDNSYLGTFKQNQTITFKQTCDSCSYSNLSSVYYPNGTVAYYDYSMAKNGIEYTISSNDTDILGCYSYSVYGDKGGTKTSETIDYRITPSGQSGNANIVFILFIVIALFFITFFGFRDGNAWITILGGMAMMGLGIYMINNGIIIYRDWLTNYFAYITGGLGFIAVIAAIASIIQD